MKLCLYHNFNKVVRQCWNQCAIGSHAVSKPEGAVLLTSYRHACTIDSHDGVINCMCVWVSLRLAQTRYVFVARAVGIREGSCCMHVCNSILVLSHAMLTLVSSWYQQGLGLVPVDEWSRFLTTMQLPLPVTFRVTGSRSLAESVLECLKRKFFSELSGLEVEGEKVPPPRPLPW